MRRVDMTNDYVKAGEILIVYGENEDSILNPLREAGFELCLIEPDDISHHWLIIRKREFKEG